MKVKNKELNIEGNKIEIPNGFGKNINDYYNLFITVADAKAGAILASNFILLGFIFNVKFTEFIIVKIFYIFLLLTIFLSIMFCCIVLFPRLPKAEKGIIFWGNIMQYKTYHNYLSEVKKLNNSIIEEEFAKQNWVISSVLESKNKYVRISIIMFVISLFIYLTTFTINIKL